jgi:DNA-binding CsgD family transcriptional regulator
MAAVDGDVLRERERESARLADALARARAGGGALAVVEGAPGIGKTRLLAGAREQARADAMTVLTARGSELERRVPFGMVRQLLDAVVLGAGDAARATLFEGAAARALSVFESRSEGELDDVLPTLHGLFWLVSNVARERPLALLFDDAQWSDEPSLHFLAYLAPRLDDLPVAAIVATRPVVDAGEPLLARVATDPSATVLRPQPLSHAALRAWADGVFDAEPDDAFVAACLDASGGNPFFVGELLREAADRRLAPDARAAEQVPRLAPDGVAAMVMLRLADAPAGARELAEAVAVLGPYATPAAAAELGGVDPEDAPAATAALARAGILTGADRPAFVHPVLRAAVERAMPAERRGAAHSAAAGMLRRVGAQVEDVAAHLVLAPPAGDPEVVELLRAAAQRAVALGVPASAIAPLERALAEPPARELRSELLLELGRTAGVAGTPAAEEHLRRAIDAAPDARARARAALELARVLKYGGGGPDAVPVVERCLAETGDGDIARLLEIELLCTSTVSRSVRSRLRGRLDALAEPAAGATGLQAAVVWASLAFDSAAHGEPAERGTELARRARAALPDAIAPPADWILLMAMAASIFCEAFEQGERICAQLIADARRRGTALPLAGAIGLRSLLNVRRGRIDDTEADAAFALRLAQEVHGTDVFVTLARSSGGLAALDRGATPEELRALLGAMAGDRPDFLPFSTLQVTRGVILLELGEPAAALTELLAAGRTLAEWTSGPGAAAWRPPAALALQRLGEDDEARAHAARELELARAFGAPRALGVALRTVALVAGGDPRPGLREAIAVLERGDAPLELARTLVELGAAERRARRPVDSREPLRRAAELALRCGAHAVARRAREELLAGGARPRRIALSGAEALTPSERRIAQLAAGGRTNREIAQELYVTEKTVEGHLSRTYDKLGIRSRTGLADALGVAAAAAAT